MEKGNIIILNGVSSSGKSTLAKVLQERISYPLYYMDVDTFASMTPEKYNNSKEKDFSVQHKFVSKMFHAVKLFSDMGFNLVVPCIFLEGGNFLEDCVTLLHGYPVLFVHVNCSVDELRRREKERGNREVGGAESQLSILVPSETFDITVDTYSLSVEKCADKIIEMLNNPEKFIAFKTLWSQRTT